MHNNYPLSGCRYVDGTSYPVLPFHAHFPESSLQVLDMRLVHGMEAVVLDELDNAQKPLTHIHSQRVELAFNGCSLVSPKRRVGATRSSLLEGSQARHTADALLAVVTTDQPKPI